MDFIISSATIAVLFMLTPGVSSYVFGVNGKANTEVCVKVPVSVDNCYAESLNHPISPKAAKLDCLQRLLWFYEPEQKLLPKDLAYFSTLSKANIVNGIPQPKTGYRQRNEYRQLPDIERHNLHKAFVNLYTKGVLQKYGMLQKEMADSFYGGASFLAKNRIILAMLEDELRLENINVSLPYLDITMETNMHNPADSILCSHDFIGNCRGDVVTGPFKNFKTNRGSLWRNYASHPKGTLINDEQIQRIISQCNTDDIVFPRRNLSSEEELNLILEYHMNGVHNWFGGDMADREYAAFDPVFYMVRAFFDLIWEEFRLNQKLTCKINPETAYATVTGGPGHGPGDLLYGFDGLKNIDGLKNYWATEWYNYGKRPQCPNCGSTYLYCDKIKNACVSKSRQTHPVPTPNIQDPLAGRFGLKTGAFEPVNNFVPKRIIRPFKPSPINRITLKPSVTQTPHSIAALNNLVSSAYNLFQHTQQHNVPAKTNYLPTIKPSFHHIPPVTKHAVNHSQPAVNPIVYQSPPAAKPAVYQSPPAANPAVYQSPPAANPAVYQSPPAVNPVVNQSPSAAKPAVYQSPPAAKPAVYQSPPAANPAVYQSPPAANPAVYQSPPAVNPVVNQSPQAAKPAIYQSPPAAKPAANQKPNLFPTSGAHAAPQIHHRPAGLPKYITHRRKYISLV